MLVGQCPIGPFGQSRIGFALMVFLLFKDFMLFSCIVEYAAKGMCCGNGGGGTTTNSCS